MPVNPAEVLLTKIAVDAVAATGVKTTENYSAGHSSDGTWGFVGGTTPAPGDYVKLDGTLIYTVLAGDNWGDIHSALAPLLAPNHIVSHYDYAGSFPFSSDAYENPEAMNGKALSYFLADDTDTFDALFADGLNPLAVTIGTDAVAYQWNAEPDLSFLVGTTGGVVIASDGAGGILATAETPGAAGNALHVIVVATHGPSGSFDVQLANGSDAVLGTYVPVDKANVKAGVFFGDGASIEGECPYILTRRE